ncbi:MAG: molybdate ABC transporter substrate-binding protein [Dehalococcoidales bacterium]|nr:molybdate ABC transporter substrate-binding protein [Dehalococcoidales bacterium]
MVYAVKKHLSVSGLLLFSCVVILASIIGCSSGGEKTESILVYCGAGMSKPMDEIGRVFLEKYKVEVRYNYAGSNTLLNQMELIKEGDAYMPGATMYIDIAEEKDLVNYTQLICYHIPVITVPKGNPAGITCLEDLAKPGVRLVWGDPEAAAIGKTGKKILENNNIYDKVWGNVIATLPTMNEVMMQISLGQADASINWWDTVKTVEDIEVIEIPEEQNIISIIPIGITTFTEKEDIARNFVDFCASDEGKKIFTKYGFKIYSDLDN